MKKTDIFKDIIWIMTHDSSTVKDRKGCNPQPFLEKITDDMTEQEFLYQVRTYLASFGIIGHISFHDKKTALDYAYDKENRALINLLKEGDIND